MLTPTALRTTVASNSTSFCPSKSWATDWSVSRGRSQKGNGGAYDLPVGKFADLVQQLFGHCEQFRVAINSLVGRESDSKADVSARSNVAFRGFQVRPSHSTVNGTVHRQKG